MAAQANDFWKTLFSLRGRSARKRFWLTIGVQVLVALIGFAVVDVLSLANLPWASVPLGAALFLGYFALSICNSVKRLHDFGWSGWWVAGMVLLGLLAGLASIGGAQESGGGNIFSGLGLILLILLGALPGTEGPNKYGDPPGGPAAEPAEQPAA